MLLSAGPYLSTEGNIEEFKINDPSMLEDCDENVIGSSQGPVLVRFEMDMDDGVYGSDMRTFLWSGRTVSPSSGDTEQREGTGSIHLLYTQWLIDGMDKG